MLSYLLEIKKKLNNFLEKRNQCKEKKKKVNAIKKRLDQIENKMFVLNRKADYMINIPSEAINLSQVNGVRIRLTAEKNELVKELFRLNN